MEVDAARWETRLGDLARRHRVPGTQLAVPADGKVAAAATDVLNLETGVEATTDSVFQIGSITKVYATGMTS